MKNIILDCDPGHDDAVAIMLALGNPEINVLGITTVGGNQTLQKVTRNAQAIVTMCGRKDVPIYAGAAQPLLHKIEVAAEIHGESGLDGVELPTDVPAVQPQHAVNYLIETLMSEPAGTVTVVATGPLTNLALAVRLEPRITNRVKEVVIMGGGYHEGNKTAAAEFNIWVDPEAAAIVFDEKWPLVMVGLDLTHQALATPAEEQAAAALDTPLAHFFIGLMQFFRKAYQDNQGFDNPPVHDPCTIAYLIDPSIVETVPVPVRVETKGELTRGMTLADFRAPAPADCHTKVATKLDRERFWQLVLAAIENLSQQQTH